MRAVVLDVGGVLDGGSGDPSALFEWVRAARARGVRVALLSNAAGGPGVERLRATMSGLVDAVLVSGEIGSEKPDPAAYLAAARALGVAPAECVFVDDLEVNVRGAVAVGMVGVRCHEIDEVVGELDAMVGPGVRADEDTEAADGSAGAARSGSE